GRPRPRPDTAARTRRPSRPQSRRPTFRRFTRINLTVSRENARVASDDDLIILDGTTFWYSDPNGDLEAREHEGFFYQDVRHISTWQLRVDGCELEPLTSRRVDYFSARIVGKPNGAEGAPNVSVRRDRFVTEGVHEDVLVENLTDDPQAVRLELCYASDF